MTCSCCAAPLPPSSLICAYCGSRAEVDLNGWARADSVGAMADASCPDGHGGLEELHLAEPFAVTLGRCPSCLGLFLGLGSLEQLLRQAVGPVWDVNTPLLNSLLEHQRFATESWRYRPCPHCGEMMNRQLFGRRSGVIVDRCRDHGLWLDPGELRQLLEWSRAGGQLAHDQERERVQERERSQARRLVEAATEAKGSLLEDDLLQLLARGLKRLLR